MNFLVYVGLLSAPCDEARRTLVDGSLRLLMGEWTRHRHVHENDSAETGEGDGVTNSDKFYHWGGLLGFMALIEQGFLPGFGQPLWARMRREEERT